MKPAIFLDLDGCVLPEYGNVDERYFDALFAISQLVGKAFVGKFPSIRLVSGRDRNSVEIVASLLGIVNCWQIIEGGAYLFNPTTTEIKNHPAITPKIKKIFSMILRKRVPKILRECSALEIYPGELTCITLVKKKSTALNIEDIYLIVRKKLSDLIRKRLIAVSHSRHAVNIVPPRIGKGTAVRFLAELDGIDLSASLAIGDSEADIPLFRQVGYIGCPNNAAANCKSAVKEKKGKVSRLNYAEGVLDIIEYFFRE